MKPIAILSAAALALSALPALAQPAPDMQEPGASMTGGPGGYGQMHGQMRAQRQAEMAADVHTILRIRPDQEQAYQTFLLALHPPGGAGQPQDPGQMEAAYQTFSAVLSPEQQQVLAALRRLALDHPRWGGRGGMHRGGMGGPDGQPQ